MVVHFTDHALRRFRQRARPDLDTQQTSLALVALREQAHISYEPPTWGRWRRVPGGAFLTVGKATFPLEPDRCGARRLVAVTCIAANAPTTPRGNHMSNTITCPVCQGRGVLGSGPGMHPICPRCAGVGYIISTER